MTDEKKRELFPYFAYIYSQEINPEKYGQVESIEDWSNLIQSNQADIEKITQAAEQMSDEDWDALDQQYTEQSKASEDPVISAKKGAKLMKLKSAAKKCKCGCEMITSKAEGGKLVSKCACGCSTAKKEKGGEINKKIDKVKVSINKKQTGGDIEKPSSTVEKKGGRIKPKMQNGGKYNESEHAALIEKYKSKKTSGSDLKRLQELNKTSGHHEDGWEPKKAKATIAPKPKVDEKKAVDRIGKHKIGGNIKKLQLGGVASDAAISALSGPLAFPATFASRRLGRTVGNATNANRTPARIPASGSQNSNLGLNVVRAAASGPVMFPVNLAAGMWADKALSTPNPQQGLGGDPRLASQLFSPGSVSQGFSNITGQNSAPSYRMTTPITLPEVTVTGSASKPQNQPAAQPAAQPATQPAAQSPAKTGTPAYDTNTLWGWMKSTGTGDASYGGRRALWNKFYGSTGGSAYTGTADQNTRLLEAMKKANTMGVGIEKAAAYTNMPSLKVPSIKKIDPTKKLESKNPEVKKPETKPTI